MVELPDKKASKRKAAASPVDMVNEERKANLDSSKPARADVASLAAPAEDEQSEDAAEVEVLSHAEQRKRRKLEKAKALQSVDGVDASQSEEAVNGGTKTMSADQPKQSRSTYGIWVGNLAFKTDADKLKDFFSTCGNITRVNLPKGTKFQPNKGFAYIDFDTREAVEQAIGLSESGLDGRRLLIKDSSDYKGRPKNGNVDAAAKALLGGDGKSATQGENAGSAEKSLSKTARKILERQKNPPAPTLFIGNLAYDATIDSIREAFEARAVARQRWESKSKKGDRKGKGKAADSDDSDPGSQSDDASDSDEASDSEQEDVKSKKQRPESTSKSQGDPAGIRQVRIGTFEDSGKCKGWAFIDFFTAAQATQSLIDGRNHYMNGRTLTVEFASADAVRRGGGKMEGVDASSSQKKGRPAFEGRAPSGKRKREEHDGQTADSTPGREVNQEHEAPKQAFYRPPLAPQPWKEEAAKIHKPNKAERQALREERKTKGKRQKPGAALANAQREKIAIQPAAGKKTTFE